MVFQMCIRDSYIFVLPSESPKDAYDTYIYWPFFTHADSLLIGVTAAYVFVNRPQWVERLNTCLLYTSRCV